MSSPEQPPREGALIRLARKARGLSVKEAASRVPIRLGESRWYHIEAGHEGKGKVVIAPPETYAHMARAVGLTPEQVEEVGRRDAADILREILRQDSALQSSRETPRPKYSDPGLQAIWEITDLTEHERRMAINGIQLLREQDSYTQEQIAQRDAG